MLGAQAMAQAIPALPKLPPITGDSVLCAGSSAVLTDAIHGGTWSSSNTAVATIGSATGIFTGVGAGTATITYDIMGVTRTTVVTVNGLPAVGTITGGSTVCSGAAITTADAVTGGIWSSGAPAIASVSAAGAVNGIAPGTATISYTLTNSCGSASATRIVTVNAVPVVGTISGVTTFCNGATTAMTDAVPGGTWHSSNALIATVSAAGVVAGVATGTAIISYTVANSCGSAVATTIVTVNSASSAGAITGVAAVFVGSAITLTDAASGGTWSASNTNATVSATGLVTGVAPGTVIISYTVVSSCGAVTATKVITVSHAIVSPISAYFDNLCAGTSLTYWDVTIGGTWSISPASVATVSPTGVVTGISAGTATLSYTYSGSTVTLVITVNPSPAPISGPDSLCVWSTMLLTDPTPGGVWSSDLPSKASVSSTGLVTCLNHSEMNVPIYYTMPNGCKAVHIFVTDSIPGAIIGPVKVCLGSSITLSDTTRNGFWSGGSSYAAIGGSGDVTGLGLGTAAITFTSTSTGCYRVSVITVNPLPAAISGTLKVCTGAVTFVSDITPGISWASSDTALATISGSGAILGKAAGAVIISYTGTNGCISKAVVTVNASPGAVASILGPSSISHSGASVTLSDATPGGVWSSSNTAILTVGSSSGIVTAIVSAGSAYIKYTVTNSFGCSNSAIKTLGTTPSPPHHGGSTTTTVGTTVNIADEASGGEWTSSDNNIATVDGNGTVTGIAPGSADITHTVLDNNGDRSETVTQIVVNPVLFEVSMFPNPNNGSFTLLGSIGSKQDEVITIEITDMSGNVISHTIETEPGGIINEHVSIGMGLANGIYLLTVKSKNEQKILRFVVER